VRGRARDLRGLASDELLFLLDQAASVPRRRQLLERRRHAKSRAGSNGRRARVRAGSVRFSMGGETTADDVDALIGSSRPSCTDCTLKTKFTHHAVSNWAEAATAVGTLVLAVATFSSVRSGNRQVATLNGAQRWTATRAVLVSTSRDTRRSAGR